MGATPTSLRAAVYARVSTEEQAQSVDTQVADARRFCDARGWEVAAVYRDEGVSGANFTTRPEFLRMLLDVEIPARPWDVLVVRDLDRIGRDQAHTIIAIEKVIETGALIFTYSNAEQVRLDPMQKVMLGVRAAFAEYERAMIVGRVRGSLEHLARRGLATGGAVFGYRNTRRPDGLADFEIDDRQAAIVREIFELRAAGEGIRAIASNLNAKGIAPPRAGGRGTGSWSPSVVHEILRRERYLGVVVWGAMRKGYKAGRKVRTAQEPEALVRAEREDLRIIDPELWARVQAHRGPAASPRRGKPARYLLTGFARCARCGGPMTVSSKRHGKVDIKVYLCAWARDRGPTVCTSKLRRPVEELDDTVLNWFRSHVLDEEFVADVLVEARQMIESRVAAPDPREALELDLRRIEGEIERLADVIARCDANAPEALVRKVTERTAKARALRAEINAVRGVAPTALAWEELEREARRRIADLKRLFGSNTEESRRVLGALLAEPLRCAIVTVDGHRRFKLTGGARVPVSCCEDLAGEVRPGKVKPMASPEGFGECDVSNRAVARLSRVAGSPQAG